MNLKLIPCAFGRHKWLYSQRGTLDSGATTRRCERCREPAQEGFWITDVWGQHGFFRRLHILDF